MNVRLIKRLVSICILSLATTGCAAKIQQRNVVLEKLNTDLTERLNVAMGESKAASRELQNTDGRLLAALDEVEALRVQLEDFSTSVEPVGSKVAQLGTSLLIAVEGNSLFTPGGAKVRERAYHRLDTIVSAAQNEHAGKDILVLGHTDNKPISKSGWVDNYQLSSERALAIVRYLKEHGVDPERLIAGGCGEHRPRAGNDTQTNRAKNRRIEVYALQPLAGS